MQNVECTDARKLDVAISSSGVEYVVDIVKVTKQFGRVKHASYSTLKSAVLGILQGREKARRKSSAVTTAIRDLTMRIPRGASVGLIGRNGSGKSTFLKLLTGIYTPSFGTIRIKGRIAALIELGAGFHPDFTGRENLHLAGIMHGLSKHEIEQKFDTIVAFAELEDVIDEPVRTYSSGMFMRLGFSIAVHTDPDILLIDEVLAVGDAGFVAKCKDRIGELQKQGKTLIMVTHDLESVERWCDEAIWLDKGVVKDRGHPRRVIDAYRTFIEKDEESRLLETERAESEDSGVGVVSKVERWGSREIEITDVEILNGDAVPVRVLHPDDALAVEISFRVNTPQQDVVFGVGLSGSDGQQIFGSNTDIDNVKFISPASAGTVRFRIDRIGLVDGNYDLDVAVHSQSGYPFDYHKGALRFSVRSDGRTVGVYSPKRDWAIVPAEL